MHLSVGESVLSKTQVNMKMTRRAFQSPADHGLGGKMFISAPYRTCGLTLQVNFLPQRSEVQEDFSLQVLFTHTAWALRSLGVVKSQRNNLKKTQCH